MIIRKFTDKDIDLLRSWLNKPYIRVWYKNLEDWIKEVEKRNTEYSFIHHFIAEEEEKPIGFCQYYDYRLGSETWHNQIDIEKTYSIDYLIGSEEYLGRHLGTKMVLLLEEEIKKEGAKKIIVQPEKENTVSRKTLLSAGYDYDKENDIFFKCFPSKGLCSVTFRRKSCSNIIRLCQKARLSSIEWGGDIHLSPNKTKRAEKVKKLCDERGIEIFSYGSYFRLGRVEDFKKVLDISSVLGVKVIRVWAGGKNAEDYSQEEFLKLVDTVRVCCDMAKEKGMLIACEYHIRTFNNSAKNFLKLSNAVDKDNFCTYWQPNYWNKNSDNVSEILLLKDKIVCVHVYAWENRKRKLLCEDNKWQEYRKVLPASCHMYLEFVKQNRVKNFWKDALFFRTDF